MAVGIGKPACRIILAILAARPLNTKDMIALNFYLLAENGNAQRATVAKKEPKAKNPVLPTRPGS